MKSDKIKVAYLVRPVEGGIKSHILTLMSGLDKSRFEAVLICPPYCSLYQEAERAGHTVIPLDLIGDVDASQDFIAWWQLRKILCRVRPDILHIHSTKAALVGRLAVASMFRRPKVIVTMHSFVFDERVGKWKRMLISYVERRLARYASRIITVSQALRRELITEMNLSPKKVQVIYNGLVFQDLPKPPHDGIRIGTVARLAPQKGVEHFIRAASIVREKYPSARFIIVGDGPFRYWLETAATILQVKDVVEFMGFRKDALSIAAGFDVFVLTSIHETFGLALVEAMSQGVPVVASNVGGVPEIVDGESTGLLAEPGIAQDIADKICLLLEDRELAAKIGRQGSEFVRSHFNAERMMEEIQGVYGEMVNG